MNKLLLPFFALSLNAFASEARKDPFPDQNISCVVTSDNKRYHDIFLIGVREKGYSHLKYKRIHLASPKDGEGNLLYGEWESIRGCYYGIQVVSEHYPERLIIECQKNGEEGSFTLYEPSGEEALKGELYFYMPQIGYPERTLLELNCERGRL